MRIVRDGAGFLRVGALQVAVDSGVYVALTTLLGMTSFLVCRHWVYRR